MSTSSGDSNVIIPTNTKAILYPDSGSGDFTILFHFEGESSYITNLTNYISSAYINDTSVATVSLSSSALNVHPIQFGTTYITLVPRSGYTISPSRIPVYIYRYPKSGTELITDSGADDLVKVELGSGISQMNDTFYRLSNLSEIDATKCPNVPICHGYPLDAIDPDYEMLIPCEKEMEWRLDEGWGVYSAHMKSDCEVQPTILKVQPQFSCDYVVGLNFMITNNGTLLIDWGDGSQETFSGEYAYGYHEYEDSELRTITVTPTDGATYTLGDIDDYPLVGCSSIGSKETNGECHILKELTIGSDVVEICDYGIACDYDLNCNFTIPASVQRVGRYFMYNCISFRGIITVNTPAYPTPNDEGAFICDNYLDPEDDSPMTFGVFVDGPYAETWIQAWSNVLGIVQPLHNANVTEIWFAPSSVDLYDVELNLTSAYDTTFIVDWGDGSSQTLTGREIHAPHTYLEDTEIAIIKIKANHDYTLGYYNEETWPDHNGLLGASDVSEGIVALVASKNVVGIAKWGCAFAIHLSFVRFAGESLLNIDDYAFFQTAFLCRVFLPESLLTIGESGFSYSGLYNFVMPNSVTTIGRDCLSYMENVQHITISEKIYELPFCTFGFDMELLTVGTTGRGENNTYLNVGSVTGGTFVNCRKLYNISFGNALTSIGCDAFAFCGYTTGAYLEFTSLDHVPVITEDACEYGYGGVFNNTGGSFCTLCVPTSLKTAFQTASIWSNYASKIYSGAQCGPV